MKTWHQIAIVTPTQANETPSPRGDDHEGLPAFSPDAIQPWVPFP